MLLATEYHADKDHHNITAKLMKMWKSGELVATNRVKPDTKLYPNTSTIFEFNFVTFYLSIIHNRDYPINSNTFIDIDINNNCSTYINVKTEYKNSIISKRFFFNDYNVIDHNLYNLNALFTNIVDLLDYINKVLVVIKEVKQWK